MSTVLIVGVMGGGGKSTTMAAIDANFDGPDILIQMAGIGFCNP